VKKAISSRSSAGSIKSQRSEFEYSTSSAAQFQDIQSNTKSEYSNEEQESVKSWEPSKIDTDRTHDNINDKNMEQNPSEGIKNEELEANKDTADIIKAAEEAGNQIEPAVHMEPKVEDIENDFEENIDENNSNIEDQSDFEDEFEDDFEKDYEEEHASYEPEDRI